MGKSNTTKRVRLVVAVVAAPLLAVACQSPPQSPELVRAQVSSIDVDVYRRAETERAARLAAEVVRLRDDLRQAEEALVTAESGLRGDHSRADAISNLAAARIQVERAADEAPWFKQELAEANSKLDEAGRQVEQGHFGAALFFVYRARRIADNVENQARRVYAEPGTRFVGAPRVNMRSGPSTEDPVLSVLESGMPVHAESSDDEWVLVRSSTGDVGWVHRSLLRQP